MANTLTQSLGTILQSDTSFGSWHVCRFMNLTATTTAATATNGYTIWQRFPQTVTIPTITTATAAFLTYGRMWSGVNQSSQMAALEYTHGTMTFNGATGSFAAGTAAPTRQIIGASGTAQWASTKPMLYVSTTAVATTPAITITYTNQAGTGSRTASITLPTSVTINSAFNLIPYLQSGDTGIRSVQNIQTSAGTSGVIKVVGLFPLIYDLTSVSGQSMAQPLTNPQVMYQLLAADVISFWRSGSTAATVGFADLTFMGDS